MLCSGKNTPRVVQLLSIVCSIVEVDNVVVDPGQEIIRIRIFEWDFVCHICQCDECLSKGIHNNKAAGDVE
jgi:hypothetical protein